MKDCSCRQCVSACETYPGWFAPGEAEKAADYLQIPFEEFKKALVVDHCSAPYAKNAPYVWSPRKEKVDEGIQIRTGYHQRMTGKCVFLKDMKCLIHPVKPYECRVVMGCDFKHGVRDKIEQMYIEAGAPLGMRPEEPEPYEDRMFF